jgi:hypothetical protein
MYRIAVAIGLTLLIPLNLVLLALWEWRPGAFFLAFVLMFGGAGLAYEMVAKDVLSNKAYRFAVGVALAAVLILGCVNAAVGGILGDDPANMMYFGVFLVGFIGALIAHVEALGMSRALFATAFAMVMVPHEAIWEGCGIRARASPSHRSIGPASTIHDEAADPARVSAAALQWIDPVEKRVRARKAPSILGLNECIYEHRRTAQQPFR